MSLEEQLTELRTLAKSTMRGDHKKVAERCGISIMYLYNIRKGRSPLPNVLEVRKLLQKIINNYRKIQMKRKRDVEQFEKQNQNAKTS